VYYREQQWQVVLWGFPGGPAMSRVPLGRIVRALMFLRNIQKSSKIISNIKHNPEIIQKSSKNHPKIIQKSSKNRQKSMVSEVVNPPRWPSRTAVDFPLPKFVLLPGHWGLQALRP